MKRILGAIAAGVVAFSGIYALAASLSVTSDNLGAGTAAVAACQSATLNATYTPLSYTGRDRLHGRHGDRQQPARAPATASPTG